MDGVQTYKLPREEKTPSEAEGMEAMLLTSIKKRGHSPTHTLKLNHDHICSVLMLFLSSLLASLLTYWYLPTTAQVTIELVPPNVFQGENVRLEVHNLPEDFLAFAWYRGVTNMKRGIAVYAKRKGLNATGPAYSGRQTMYSDGSLLLQRVILKDTGFYTLRVISRQGEIVSTTSVFLHVQSKWSFVNSGCRVGFIPLDTQNHQVWPVSTSPLHCVPMPGFENLVQDTHGGK